MPRNRNVFFSLLSPVLSFVTFPGLCLAQEVSCKYGSEQTVTACSHLSVIAGWEGGGPKSATCTYNPPAGWAIVDTNVDEESSNNGHSEVNTLAENLNFASDVEVKDAYTRAIDLAVKEGKQDAEAHLKNQEDSHLIEVQKFSTNKNTIFAKVYAEKHGSFIDRKRGWEQISVMAHLRCIGGPDGEMLFQDLKKQYSL